MSKSKSSMRGRGEEIVGRGVDALFSSPSPTPESPRKTAATAPAPAESAEDELDELLAAEANNATGADESVATGAKEFAARRPAPALPPSPIRRAAASIRPQPPTPQRPKIAGGGIFIPDDELLGGIDVPFGPNDAIPTDPARSPIDIPPAFEDTTAIEPRFGAGDDSGLLDLETESPVMPSPIRPEPTSPSPPLTPRPDPPPPIQPSPPIQPAAINTSAASIPEDQLPPSRPRVDIGGRLAEVYVSAEETDTLRPSDPFARPTAQPTVEQPRPQPSAEEQSRIIDSVNSERIIKLHAQIDWLYREIPKTISNRPELSSQAMGMLRQARTILYEKPYDFVEAEYKVQQALTLYNRIENSEKWADKYGWRVFWFEVLVFFLFLVSFLGLLAFGQEFSKFVAGRFKIETPGQGMFTAVGFWATFVWGGIGGVVGAMYILWTHVSERQDFERQHVMWYVAQPIMGLILGGVTFLIINTGLLSLQGGAQAAAQLQTEVQLFPALIAFIAGFRPQFVFGLLVKIIKVINPDND